MDLPRNLQSVVFDAGGNHADPCLRLVLICAKDGRDYMSVLHQRAKELKLMRNLGIPVTGEQFTETPTEPEDDGSEPKE